MKQVTAVLAVLALVLLGFIAGVLGTHLYYAKRLQRGESFALMASEFFAQRLERELDLTEGQIEEIGAILDETRLEADALRSELKPRIGALMEGAADRIADVLTSEQRERFAELRERYRARADHFLLGPPGRRGPGGPRWRGPRRGFPPGPPPMEEPPAEEEASEPETSETPEDG